MEEPDEEGRVAAYFPDDFKEYVDTQLNRCPVVDDGKGNFWGWVFWSREDDQSEHPPSILDLKKKIKNVLLKCLLNWFEYPTLIQFWAPTMTMDGRSYLTTQNQPFALSTYGVRIDDLEGPVKGFCGYRMISMGYKFYMDRESSDEQLGVPGRVFKHRFPESTPNVEYYSIKEYPLLHRALRCQVAQSLAIPLFDPSTHLCVGVLEMVSTASSKGFQLNNYDDRFGFLAYLEEVGLESSISVAERCRERFPSVEKFEALDEISKVLEVVRKDHGLPLAQAWAPCKVDWTCSALVKGDIFHVIRDSTTCEYWKFNWANTASHLRKGQGVVGRAFSSPHVLFCKDVTQLSIIDYPLAHYARYHKLGCCFAICLQSSCTGNDIYVLECFMPPSNEDYYGNQQTALRKILATMKKIFHTFKLASGEELGGHLYIEEIPFQNGEKLDSVQMSQTTKSLPMLAPLQSGGEMTQLDLSNQQSMDALNNEEGRVAAYFPDDFKQYVDTQLNRCSLVDVDDDDDDEEDIFCGWVFWSREDDQSEHPPNILDLKKKIKDVLGNCLHYVFGYPTLLQFWAPTKTMEGRSCLTTQNQPFALWTMHYRSDDVKGLCGYRMISMDYKFYMDRESSDEQLGVPGRVFKRGFPEFTPNVEYYSIKEYPLRDHALLCQLKYCWAIPLFDPSTHLCVGVLEMVSTWPSVKFLSDCHINLLGLHKYLEEVGLESSISHAETNLNVRQSEALDEINKVLEVVREDHGLPLAQAWAPCKVDWTCRDLAKGDIFHVIRNSNAYGFWRFNWTNAVSHLRKGQGVVGRAFSSSNVLFCKDVTQLSIIDYPLAHYARDRELGCCFAICLQSSCTRNDIYVLECFMPPSNEDYYGNQQTAVRKILETMKKNFHTFKLASGEELGGHLYIEEILFQNGEKLDFVQMSQTTKSLPMLEPLQSGREMTQLDLSNQQSMDALNNESNVVSAERSNIDVTCSQDKGKAKRPKRVHNKTGVKIEIPLDDILQNSKKSIEVAADNLQVSRSTLKRVCRRYGFSRWPPRKKNMVGSSQPSESSPGVDHQQILQLSSDQPFSRALPVVVHTNPRNTVIRDANIVTVKAKYINDIIIKFSLSLSSGLVELQQQIANRLHLEDGTYYVKYKDEDDDLIVIACDQDLQDYISSSKSLGSTTIMVFIVPK